jgi:RNA polymerase sigma-70 factor (sigma-E family)
VGLKGVETSNGLARPTGTVAPLTMDKDRSRDEFERFVAEVSGDLLRTAYLVQWDLPTAEDLVQECLIKVARRWYRVRTMERPAAYAKRILINLAIDGAKRSARHRSELEAHPALEEGLDETAARDLGLVEYKHELMLAVGALPPRQRATLVLRYFEDLSESQTAELLGWSIGTVKSTTSRALDRLRQALPSAAAIRRPDTSPERNLALHLEGEMDR